MGPEAAGAMRGCNRPVTRGMLWGRLRGPKMI